MEAALASYFPPATHFLGTLLPKINDSVETIKTALSRYRSNIVVCFNGGKDATVLLDLVTRVNTKSSDPVKIRPFYLKTTNDFPEVLSFLDVSERFWKIELLRLETPSLKDGLRELITRHDAKAVFLGVRHADLDVCAHVFEPTTAGWPEAMRVSPILNWNYHEVWNYIEALGIPVCELYQKGYTSIGTKDNTKPNPSLWCAHKNKYLHARHLQNAAEERNGRF